MYGWGVLEPKDIEVLQMAFKEIRARTRLDRESAEAIELARYLFDLYASGVDTVPELVRKTIEARKGR